MAALSIECSVCIIIKMCFKSLLIKGGDYIHARVHNLFSGVGVGWFQGIFYFPGGGMHIFGNVKFKKFEFFRGNFPPPPTILDPRTIFVFARIKCTQTIDLKIIIYTCIMSNQ